MIFMPPLPAAPPRWAVWIPVVSAVVVVAGAAALIVFALTLTPSPRRLVDTHFECTTPDGVIAHDVWWWHLEGDRVQWTTGQGDSNVRTLRRPYSCSSWRLPE